MNAIVGSDEQRDARAFADFVESDFDLERVGEYPTRGFNHPIELFAYHG